MFVMHNPVRFTDPSGLFAVDPSAGIFILPVPDLDDGWGIPWLIPDPLIVEALANLLNEIGQAAFDLMTWRQRLAFRAVRQVNAMLPTIERNVAIPQAAAIPWGAARLDRAEARTVVEQLIASGQTPIFRMGSGNATNFTPREGEAALSFTLTMPTGQFSVTTLEIINATGVLRAVIDGANHVSVFPTNPADLAKWQASRLTALESPYYLTTLLQNISVRAR